jgi:hypothetical protein
MALVNSGLSTNAQYEQLRQYLDVDSFIDYMIMNHYAGNTDWANHNWYAFRKRTAGAGFQFVSWDAEITMKSVTENVTGYNQPGTPTEAHSFLRNNAEYRLKFADHVQKQYFNGGPLYVDTNNPAVDPANPQRNRPGAIPEANWRGGSGECAGIGPVGGQRAGPDQQSVYAGRLPDGTQLDDEHLLPATIE